ncbi:MULTISPECIES: hypothetical protein [Oscillatoriales]|nr:MULTISPECIES: hypothetical protein [Oscillatoriales]
MEWLTQLEGRVVGLDSAPLIYFIEENPTTNVTIKRLTIKFKPEVYF